MKLITTIIIAMIIAVAVSPRLLIRGIGHFRRCHLHDLAVHCHTVQDHSGDDKLRLTGDYNEYLCLSTFYAHFFPSLSRPAFARSSGDMTT